MTANAKALGSLAGIAPASDAFTLTPHASDEMEPNRGFCVTAGTVVTIRAINSGSDVVQPVIPGVIYPIAIKYLRVSGTDATGILGYN